MALLTGRELVDIEVDFFPIADTEPPQVINPPSF